MGYFGGIPDLEHYIPPDDYAHVKDAMCGCMPRIQYVRGFGGAIIHTPIKVEPLPDSLPADWT